VDSTHHNSAVKSLLGWWEVLQWEVSQEVSFQQFRRKVSASVPSVLSGEVLEKYCIRKKGAIAWKVRKSKQTMTK
jgi:hypothetical protein